MRAYMCLCIGEREIHRDIDREIHRYTDREIEKEIYIYKYSDWRRKNWNGMWRCTQGQKNGDNSANLNKRNFSLVKESHDVPSGGVGE